MVNFASFAEGFFNQGTKVLEDERKMKALADQKRKDQQAELNSYTQKLEMKTQADIRVKKVDLEIKAAEKEKKLEEQNAITSYLGTSLGLTDDQTTKLKGKLGNKLFQDMMIGGNIVKEGDQIKILNKVALKNSQVTREPDRQYVKDLDTAAATSLEGAGIPHPLFDDIKVSRFNSNYPINIAKANRLAGVFNDNIRVKEDMTLIESHKHATKLAHDYLKAIEPTENEKGDIIDPLTGKFNKGYSFKFPRSTIVESLANLATQLHKGLITQSELSKEHVVLMQVLAKDIAARIEGNQQ